MQLYQSLGKIFPHLRVKNTGRKTLANRYLLIFFWVVFLCCPVCPASGGTYTDSPSDGLDLFGLPTQYGQIIYQNSGSGAKQLYIIGISHRDPLNGSAAPTTLKAQTEIFRIGEWLKKTRDMQLLLPEGYFQDTAGSPSPSAGPREGVPHFSSGETTFFLDNDLLFRQLEDAQRFVNAEMLLMDNYHLPASQIEDRQVYDAVRRSLSSLYKRASEAEDALAARLAELSYLQQTRTATLLQNIPSVIDLQMQSGLIHNRSAMFTIGLNHLQDIIRYLQDDAISIDAPAREGRDGTRYKAELNLHKNGYGVTVILPRTLADDRQLLQLTNLDHIFPAAARQSQTPWLN